MKKLAYIPIPKSKFHAYESDVEGCSEIYDMEGVTQINKICEIVDNEINIDHPLYSVEKEGKHYLLLDRSLFQLQTFDKVLSFCRLWVETESIQDILHYNNR